MQKHVAGLLGVRPGVSGLGRKWEWRGALCHGRDVSRWREELRADREYEVFGRWCGDSPGDGVYTVDANGTALALALSCAALAASMLGKSRIRRGSQVTDCSRWCLPWLEVWQWRSQRKITPGAHTIVQASASTLVQYDLIGRYSHARITE